MYHDLLNVQFRFNITRSYFPTQLLSDEIPTGDIGILRNADMAGGEFQTGDIVTPLTGPRSIVDWSGF